MHLEKKKKLLMQKREVCMDSSSSPKLRKWLLVRSKKQKQQRGEQGLPFERTSSRPRARTCKRNLDLRGRHGINRRGKSTQVRQPRGTTYRGVRVMEQQGVEGITTRKSQMRSDSSSTRDAREYAEKNGDETPLSLLNLFFHPGKERSILLSFKNHSRR